MLNLCSEFQELLHRACKKIHGESILLSGGLDSTLLLYYMRPRDAITISIDPYSPDYRYSSIVAKKYSKNHYIVMPRIEEVCENLEELIRDFKTFDAIFLKNSVVQLIGFKEAIRLKANAIILGDGADELFGGYNFLSRYIKSPEILQTKLDEITKNMEFVSFELSRKYNIRIITPFLDEQIIKFSNSLPVKDKIATHNGIIYGKFFLRNCFRVILGEEIAWRRKEALESGSGIIKVLPYLENSITDKDFLAGFKKAKHERVLIRNKEHLFYYRIYRKFFDAPFHQISDQLLKCKRCPFCNTLFIWKGSFCKTCGAYPV